MKYLIIILTTLLIWTRPIDPKKIKKEKREYEIEVQSNGTIIKKLKKTTTYSIDGHVVSEIEACKDSICCPYNKTFKLYSVKREFLYKDQRLILRKFWSCDSLPVYKDFHEYKFDNRKRLVEKRELTYNFETDSKKYENGQWVSAKIGDSTLTEKNIHQYNYTAFDSVREEKITVWSKYSNSVERSWTVTYKYDQDKRLIEMEHPPYGDMKLKAQWFYDERGRVTKTESNLTGEKRTIELSYDDKGRVSSQNNGTMTTRLEYDNNGKILLVSTKGNRYNDSQTKYHYNEFGDVTREEVSSNNETTFVTAYEYIYY
jgi:YD repeat-containing protein